MNDAGATSNAITQAADRFEAARREARIIDLPDNLRPRDLAAGFAVQAELARRAGSVGGWKISYLTFQQQALKGVDRPIAGAIHGPCVLQSPARPGFGFVKPMLECEFAFMLARDLPVRAKPYLRGEVEAEIGRAHV